MKSTALRLSLAALLSGTRLGDALSLRQRQDAPPNVVSLDLRRTQIPDPVTHDRNRLRRRDGTVNATLDNLQTLYFINATLGTPGTGVRLHLDTGSSDLWVNTPNSTLCSQLTAPCNYSGTYDANSSSTYNYVGSYFNISYIDGSGAGGDYVTDNVRIAGVKLDDLQFGVGYSSSSSQSILGVGYALNEVQLRAGLEPYPNLPAKMVDDGVIATNAYSIWLNDLNADSGSILFGGVDRSRYQGDLVSLPVQKVGGAFAEFFVTMTGIDLGSDTIDDNMALGVLFDSGSSLTYLPNDMVRSIYDKVNATYQEVDGVAFVPCSLGQQDIDLTFHFSSPASIAVPMSELVLEISDVSGRQLSYASGVAACLFGIAPAGTSTKVLGDTFLRSAYVVYDLENNEISVAQTKLNFTGSDIVEITKGDDNVPSAVTPSDPVSAKSGLPDSGAGMLTSSGVPAVMAVAVAAVGIVMVLG